MRIKLLLFFCFSSFVVFSQKKSIDKFIYKSEYEHLEHVGSPKSIFVKKTTFDRKGKELDYLSSNHKAIYNNQDKIIKHFVFGKDLQNPFKIITYDSLNRISKVEINRENEGGEITLQYFNQSLKYPDSLKTYSKKRVEQRKIVNRFKNNLITRRDLFEKDTLRYYTIFEYDSKNRLTKELNINTKDGFGTTINFSGTPTKKIMNRNDSIMYHYENKNDTIIVYREQFKGLIVANKVFKKKNIEIKIEEEITNGKPFIRKTKFIWKDSTIIKHNYYKGKQKKELKSYYNRAEYKDKIISTSKNPYRMRDGLPEEKEVTTIQTVLDKYGNWVKKTFIWNKIKLKEIKRIIVY